MTNLDENGIDVDSPKMRALDCACGAADAGMQGVYVLWNAMSDAEREAWRRWRVMCWPRLDLVLDAALPAAAQVLAEERAAGAGSR